jgi:mono/diheme cytochrome c family protein
VRQSLAALLAGLLCVPPAAVADNCRRATTYTPAYVAPAYGHGYYDYAYQQYIIVPKAFQIVKALDSYSAVGDEYRQAYFAKLVADELARIADAKRQLEAPPAPQPQPVPNLAPNPAIPPAKGDANGGTARTFKAMLDAKCAKCHQPNTKRLDLTGDPNRLTFEQRGEIVDRIMAPESETGFMPKDSAPVTGEELTAAWRFKLAAKK